MKEYDILEMIEETSAMIAFACGMDVPYAESMDMDSFPHIIYAILDENDPYAEEPDIDTLRFLAENGRLLPESLENAGLDAFRAYCREHADELMDEIEEECTGYQEEYEEYEEEEE